MLKSKGKLDQAWARIIEKAVKNGTSSATPHPVALPIELAHTVPSTTCRCCRPVRPLAVRGVFVSHT